MEKSKAPNKKKLTLWMRTDRVEKLQALFSNPANKILDKFEIVKISEPDKDFPHRLNLTIEEKDTTTDHADWYFLGIMVEPTLYK